MTGAANAIAHRRLMILNERGLHARAAARFVSTLDGYSAVVEVEKDGTRVSGRFHHGVDDARRRRGHFHRGRGAGWRRCCRSRCAGGPRRETGSMSRRQGFELAGLGIAPGIAIGSAYVTESGALEVPTHTIAADSVAGEVERFRDAVVQSREQLGNLSRKAQTLHGSAAEELEYLLAAHSQMLEGSRLVRGVEARIRKQCLNAEAAVSQEVGEIVKAFARMNDSYLAERSKDLRDVGQRLLRNLMATPYRALTDLPEGTVVVADELTPADTALLDPRCVAGIVTASGGAQDHTSILARSLGLPAVVATSELLDHVKNGDLVIVDGGTGKVVVNPDAGTERAYERRRTELQLQARKLQRLRDVPAVSRDDVRISLMANIELASEIDPALDHGAEGVGLFRTEYLFLNRDSIPGEDEQYAHLANVVERMAGRTVTIRTLDAGNDKLPYSLGEHVGISANPAMGLRAIRLSLKFEKLLEDQLAAILRAGAHGRVRILLPMISTVSEVRQVRKVRDRVANRLLKQGIAIADPIPPVGVMIEIPGAALAADSLAGVSDFFSIGTKRSDDVHACHRPGRRPGGPSLQPAPSRGASADPVHHRRGAACRHRRECLR